MKRQAPSVAGRLSMKRRPEGVSISILKKPAGKRPAAHQTVKRKPAGTARAKSQVSLSEELCRLGLPFPPVVALSPTRRGDIVFSEQAVAFVQAQRSDEEHAMQQPLFCAECGFPAGPIEATLALASGRISRSELLEFVRSNQGDSSGLQRWLDFASKTPAVPRLEGMPVSDAVFCLGAVSDVDTHRCFHSEICRSSWCAKRAGQSAAWERLEQHAADSSHGPILLLAAKIVTQTAQQFVERGELQHLAKSLSTMCAIGIGADRKPAVVPRKVVRESRILLIGACQEKSRSEIATIVTVGFYIRFVDSIEERCWLLNGETMPSAMGRYCEAVCAKTVPTNVQVEALRIVGPVAQVLLDQMLTDTESEDDGADSDDDDDDVGQLIDTADAPPLQLMAASEAQRTQPILVPGLFSAEDIALVRSVSQELTSQEHHKHADSALWRTRYLHAGGHFRTGSPELMAKLVQAAIMADSGNEGWGLLRGYGGMSSIRPRVIEHHIVAPGGSLADPTHFDGGSVLTIDVMLSDPRTDFTGGEFCTTESSGESKQHRFGLGDALVFVSHKPHCVRPVVSGSREVLIMELWRGKERTCDHRCPHHYGVCPVEAEGAKAASADDDGKRMCMDDLARDGAKAFASTAFEGHAFFQGVAQVSSQSDVLRSASNSSAANVEVVYKDVGVVASLRALKRIAPGEVLVSVSAACESSSDEDDSGAGDADVDSSE